MADFKYNRDLMFLVRQRLRHVRQITKEATRTPTTDPSIPGPSMTGATHNYFVLEKHERDTANTPTRTENTENPYYSSTLIVDNYEDADAVRETNFGTTDARNEHVTRSLGLGQYGQQPIRYVFDTDLADTIRIRYDTHVHNYGNTYQ